MPKSFGLIAIFVGVIYLLIYKYSRISGNKNLIKVAIAFWGYGLAFLAYQDPSFQSVSRVFLGAQVVAALFIAYYSVLIARFIFTR